MSAIDHFVLHSKRIPSRILQKAFPPTCDHDVTTTTDRMIKNVIFDFLQPDVDVVGGEEAYLIAGTATRTIVNEYTVTYHFKDANLKGRVINAVNGAFYTRGDVASTNPNAGGIDVALDPTLILPIANVNVHLVGHNVIMVHDTTITSRSVIQYFKVSLTNDPELGNIPPKAYLKFTKLAMLALKSVIYTNLVLELEEGEIRGGVLSAKLSNIVDDYESAYDEYLEYLETTWKQVSAMIDRPRVLNYLRMQVPIA